MSTVFANVHDWSGLPPTPEGLRQRNELTLRADIVAKRFLMRERRTIFLHLDRIGDFDSQNRPFGFHYCRISLAEPLLGDFCNNIGQLRKCTVRTGKSYFVIANAVSLPAQAPPHRLF